MLSLVFIISCKNLRSIFLKCITPFPRQWKLKNVGKNTIFFKVCAEYQLFYGIFLKQWNKSLYGNIQLIIYAVGSHALYASWIAIQVTCLKIWKFFKKTLRYIRYISFV